MLLCHLVKSSFRTYSLYFIIMYLPISFTRLDVFVRDFQKTIIFVWYSGMWINFFLSVFYWVMYVKVFFILNPGTARLIYFTLELFPAFDILMWIINVEGIKGVQYFPMLLSPPSPTPIFVFWASHVTSGEGERWGKEHSMGNSDWGMCLSQSTHIIHWMWTTWKGNLTAVGECLSMSLRSSFCL